MSTKFEMSKTDISSIKENLTLIERVLLENIYHILLRKKKLEKEIIEYIGSSEYDKINGMVTELKYINQWDGTLNQMKDQFFEHAEIKTLLIIINRQLFPTRYSDGIMISTDVLKEFRYSSEFKMNHPKAEIAKKLGAKLIG
jgi:hypothetical protein